MIRTVLAAALASIAVAASALAQPAKTYTLKLTTEQLNVVGAGLGELKAKDALGTVMEINRQVSEQNRPADPPPPAPDAPPSK